MNEFKLLNSEDVWSEALAASEHTLVVIFKHSVTCPISGSVHQEMEAFIKNNDIPVFHLIVQDSRELSRKIAEELGIDHESPQVIVLENREPIFDVSHYEVTKEALEEITGEGN